VRVICEECGKIAKKKPGQLRKFKHHFCNRECYLKYKSKHPGDFPPKKVDKSAYYKIKAFANIRKELMEN